LICFIVVDGVKHEMKFIPRSIPSQIFTDL